MVAWPDIRGRNAASLMIAEKIQPKSGPADPAVAFTSTPRHKLFHRDKMPMQNNFQGPGGRPVTAFETR